MCDKCDELDEKIANYRRFTAGSDPLTAKRIAALIEDLRKMRESLHPTAAQPPLSD